MKFLEEIAKEVLKRDLDRLDQTTIVFPNRRAGLFFQKYLSTGINKPVWSPKVLSIVDFIKSMTTYTVPDRLTLVYELYQAFTRISKSKESFDTFYFWGDTLLKDFDEIDKFLIDPKPLFSNLADLKDIEQTTAYLSEEQKQLIRSFWSTFDKKISNQQKDFLTIWKILFHVYNDFRTKLLNQSLAYEGMIYRWMTEEIQKGTFHDPYQTVLFAGFNALSPAEETIITWYVSERRAQIYWDADDYYLKNPRQEAGRFMREMATGNDLLAKSFKNTYGRRFAQPGDKKITLIGTPLKTGQAQVASSLLQKLHKENNGIFSNEQTALVLPDEQLLLPVLNALPQFVEKVNITMGFPLKHSPVYSFIENLVELQITRAGNKNMFHYKPVLALLQHPYVSGSGSDHIRSVVRNIKSNNRIYISAKDISGENELLKQIFSATDQVPSLIDYIRKLLVKLAETDLGPLQQEFLLHFYATLNKLNDFIRITHVELDESSFLKLFRQLVKLDKLPFEGEPLEGLQVMGAMETRNLDFDRIIIFSVNEGVLPPARPAISFIPYGLRQAFALPVFDHQEAIYAYLFYRMIQRAREVYLIYDTSEDHGQSGEISRFVKQLEFELRDVLKIEHKIIAPAIPSYSVRTIAISKNEPMIRKLDRYLDESREEEKWLTPSALNTYQECSLRFYFRYILGLDEQDEVREIMDPIMFGQIFHTSMELAYKDHNREDNRQVFPESIIKIKRNLEKVIEKAFLLHFNQGNNQKMFDFAGQNIIIREIVKKMAGKVLDNDLKYVPFEILGLEVDPGLTTRLKLEINRNHTTVRVNMGGVIDRVDKKGDVIRILDYKTGIDKKDFKDIRSLFNFVDQEEPNYNRNKAAFQTFLYGLIYKYSVPEFNGKIEAGLFNVREMYKKDFNYLLVEKKDRSKKYVDDVSPYLPAFEQHLKKLLEEIFNFEGSFCQTDDEKKCRYCPFKNLCRR